MTQRMPTTLTPTPTLPPCIVHHLRCCFPLKRHSGQRSTSQSCPHHLKALLSTSCKVEAVQHLDTWYKQHNMRVWWYWMASWFHNLILHQTYHSSAKSLRSLVPEITEDEYRVLIRNNFPAVKQSCSSLQDCPWCHNPAPIFPSCASLFTLVL